MSLYGLTFNGIILKCIYLKIFLPKMTLSHISSASKQSHIFDQSSIQIILMNKNVRYWLCLNISKKFESNLVLNMLNERAFLSKCYSVNIKTKNFKLFLKIPLSNGTDVTEYRMEWGGVEGSMQICYCGPGLSYELKGLSPATTYYCRVQVKVINAYSAQNCMFYLQFCGHVVNLEALFIFRLWAL